MTCQSIIYLLENNTNASQLKILSSGFWNSQNLEEEYLSETVQVNMICDPLNLFVQTIYDETSSSFCKSSLITFTLANDLKGTKASFKLFI